MENAPGVTGIPPSIERVLKLFRSMGREEKMQALVQYSKKLEPLPERFKDLDRGSFNVPECQTRVDIIPEVRDGRMYFYADLNARESPTIAAILAIIFTAVNGQPPSTTLAIPPDFVSILMESIGLAAREPGLNAMIMRLKRYAGESRNQDLDVTKI
jgi:cysteine desulfuration protein SufE